MIKHKGCNQPVKRGRPDQGPASILRAERKPHTAPPTTSPGGFLLWFYIDFYWRFLHLFIGGFYIVFLLEVYIVFLLEVFILFFIRGFTSFFLLEVFILFFIVFFLSEVFHLSLRPSAPRKTSPGSFY